MREALARDGHGVVDERLVLLDHVIDGEGGADILDDRADGNRQGAGTDLAVHDGVDELLLTALRVTHLHGHDLDAVVLRGKLLQLGDDLVDVGDGFGLVLLDGDGAGHVAEDLLEDGGADDDLLALLEEDAEVGGEVRLAFAAVDDQALALGSRRRGELDMGRERCAAETDDAAELDFLEQGFVVVRNLGDERIGLVDAFHPFVAFTGDFDGHDRVAGEVGARGDGLHRTGDGGMDIGGNESAGLGDRLADLDLVTDGDEGLGRGSDVLGDGEESAVRERHGLDPAFAGNLAVVRMDTADGECGLFHTTFPPSL